MKKTYTFRHFVLDGNVKKPIDPTQVDKIKDRCKLLMVNMITGKEHEIVKKEA